MNPLWNLAEITPEEWLDADTYALLAAHYGGERNLRALAIVLRSDLVKAELHALGQSGNDPIDSAHQT